MKKRSEKAKMQKNVTLDELARMMAGGFTDMGSRFGEVHDRIDELDERLSGQMNMLDQKITMVNANVLSLQYDYKKIVSRLENLELRAFGSIQE